MRGRVLALVPVILWATGCATTAGPAPRPATPSPVVDHQGPLLAQRPGQTDVYVIAVGAFGLQKVFLNEATLAEQRFSDRYQSAGRTRLLSSHKDAPDRARPATREALRAAVQEAAAVMDRDNDILLLYIAGHGRKDHHVKMRYRTDDGRVVLQDFNDHWLAQILDAAQIKRRVLIISACYSGAFIDVLQGDDRVVLTAARADRTSFGCEAGARLSYFGRAFLELGLSPDHDLLTAHDVAQRHIMRWEEERHLVPSEPARSADVDLIQELFALSRSRSSVAGGS